MYMSASYVYFLPLVFFFLSTCHSSPLLQRRHTRMRCSPTRTRRSSAPTWALWCCSWRSWELMTWCTLTSWTHQVQSICKIASGVYSYCYIGLKGHIPRTVDGQLMYSTMFLYHRHTSAGMEGKICRISVIIVLYTVHSTICRSVEQKILCLYVCCLNSHVCHG